MPFCSSSWKNIPNGGLNCNLPEFSYINVFNHDEGAMTHGEWIGKFPSAITVTDAKGTIIAMNEKAVATFKDDGGAALIGTNLLDCHPVPARAKVEQLLASHAVNCYTIEKNGKHKMIYQAPWFTDDRFSGLVEISMEIPATLPHFTRD
jgi:transcriptional regulator with PAS, ATPase and Fis domain